MREIRFAWVCRNIHFNTIERVELTDDMLLSGSYPSWITSDNCEILAKILPTGLKDRKGVEIYEGDIVRLGDNVIHDGVLVQCIWSQPIVSFVYLFLTGEHKGKCTDMVDTWRSYEVISNRYQNPELLKGEET